MLISVLFSCEKENSTLNNTSNEVSISSFNCESVVISGTLTKDIVASNVTSKLTYIGGNGKTYLTKSHTSTGVTGLTATLQAGTLANGEGTLVYTISGKATASGTASFAISLGEETCSVDINVEDATQIIGKPGPNIIDVEGNSYKTVYLGKQCWLAENLRVSKYNDGTPIPNITNNTQWENNTTGAWVFYTKYVDANSKYGKLYNWYVVSPTTNGNKNVCPTGWHMPSDIEWKILTDYLGGEGVAGGKMKEDGIINWNSPNKDAINTSLFTGLPGGSRGDNGGYSAFGSLGFWWSSSVYDNKNAWYLFLSSGSGGSGIYNKSKGNGLSIRCLKD